jgi:hypothetical protein
LVLGVQRAADARSGTCPRGRQLLARSGINDRSAQFTIDRPPQVPLSCIARKRTGLRTVSVDCGRAQGMIMGTK